MPALAPLDNLASPHGMAAISARLRAPDGCPWDRRQTHASLRPFVLEEAYEMVDAIEQGSPSDLAEELGDLFLQVILHAQLAAEEAAFDLTDVYRTLGAKIVRRHPHVFGDVEVADAAEVLRNWEAIKADERRDAGAEPSPFAGIARALPALPASREIQERASSMGWDWPAIEGVWEKVAEELDELHAAPAGDGDEARDARLHELGDVLFAIVNLARWLKLDPEEALRAANRRWIGRYERVEALAASRGQVLADLLAGCQGRALERGEGRLSGLRYARLAMTFRLDQARDALSRTPSVLRALVAGLPADWLAAMPADAEWSAHQVACHLAYVEETDWMVRARMIREVGPSEQFPPVDHGDQTGRYAGMGTDAVVERFATLRERNLADLDAMELGASELTLEGMHPTLGRVTMRELLATWVVHDHNHVAQLQGALSAHYVAEVGPWRSFLGILDRVEP